MPRAEADRGKAPPPIVRTSIDLDVQGAAADAVLHAQRKWEAQGAGNAALVVLAHGTNEVRAWVGSAEHLDERHSGSIDYTQVPRSPGSALKAFI
jgi:penicillin-binding protein 1C